MSKIIVNCETGEVIERPLSQEELTQQVIDEAKVNTDIEAATTKAAQRQALLSRLGITEEEARILLGGN